MAPDPLIIAHRGASAESPENTFAAFRRAISTGADGVEFDVQLAKDGIPVVIHDTDLVRTGHRPDKVCELTSKQLAKVDVSSWFNAAYSEKARPEFAGEGVPTLEQVLRLYADTSGPIYIELKCEFAECRELAGAVCELIRDLPLLPRVIVKSFRLAAIPEVRRVLPDVETAALFDISIMNILRRREHIIAMAREFGARQISLHYSLANSRLTSLAREAGLPVTIWTVNDPKWIARCRKRGIGALITNDPQTFLATRRSVAAR